MTSTGQVERGPVADRSPLQAGSPPGQDLRAALDAFAQAGQLIRVTEPIGWDFEAAAVLWRLAHGPAVVFENVTGYDVPIVGNVLNDRGKLAAALGLTVEQTQQRIIDAVDRPYPTTLVESAPCQQIQVDHDIDLLERFPVPRISEHDGGRYLSAGVVVARDPDSGRHNLAIARIQVHPGNRLGCYFAPTHTYQFLQRCRELGRPLEVAVVLGSHPALMAASQLLVPGDELEHAGGILGQGLQVVRCRTVDLTVPAGAEIVLEGLIDPTVAETEGPFGEFPGTYSPQRDNPVIEVQAITMRERPLFQMVVGGTHPEHLVTGAVAREATLLRAIRAVVPGARAAIMPEGGTCRFHAVVSITKRVEGEGKLAILAALSNQDLLKRVVVVDDDIDIHDPVQVEWAIATRMRADDDVVIVPGVKSNPVDPMSRNRTIAKLGIDATLGLEEARGRLPRPDVPTDVRQRIDARWDRIMGRDD
ncbi:MAG: UbiD family decarboxylase [Nitriliruptorales bacterium]|nr:UbiD family decarboxylase [Nitriliruptorales bacterium]